MPKNYNNNNNNKSRAKSARKPLGDISNGMRSSSKPNGDGEKQQQKNISVEEQQQQVGDEVVLDRLLLAHSDLSKLIHQCMWADIRSFEDHCIAELGEAHQMDLNASVSSGESYENLWELRESRFEIDELVVQALKVKGTSKKGLTEIESFTSVLADTHSSLKSWIPRFQRSLSSPSMGSEMQLVPSSPIQTFSTLDEEISNVNSSPQQFESSLRISPSPLVSWCAERNIESGKQLFLLTPLPKSKVLSSKRPGSSRSVFGKKMDGPYDTTLVRSSLLNISEMTNDDLLEGVEMRPTPTKSSNPYVAETVCNLEDKFVSPPKFSNRNRSMFLMTPCLKRSPPKSCVLLEPISESIQQDRREIHNGNQNCSSSHRFQHSSGYDSHTLAMKYPELLGLHHKCRVGNNDVVAPPAFCLSPPKSCVLMELPTEKVSNLAIFDDQSTCQAAGTNKDVQRAYQSKKKTYNQDFRSTGVAHLESTPMWRRSESIMRTGKQPGENTLKKELWTRFEAASSNSLQFDNSVLKEIVRSDFLDRLEEVSSEDINSMPQGLR